MVPKNSRTGRAAGRTARTPQSARAVRSAKAAHAGHAPGRGSAAAYSRQEYTRGNTGSTEGYRSGSISTSYSLGEGGARNAASQYSRNNPSYAKSASRRMGRGKKVAMGIVAVVLLALVGAGTAFALWTNSINLQLTRGNKSQAELDQIHDALAKTTTFTKPFYMLLIGSDKRDGDDEGGARSDTNIVLRIDPGKNQVTMISIPRDTKIDIDGYGMNKFNAAYNYGGAAATIREANQLLNINIAHYAEINFDEMVSLVDAVGGVDVDVHERIDDPDADNTTDNPGNPRIIIEAGEQHLNGQQALVFARSRAYPDGDFTRTANQRELITAIVNKVIQMPATQLPGVVQAAAKSVTTDLTLSDILGLAEQFKNKGDLTLYSAMVPSYTQNIMQGGMMVSYVINEPEATKKMMDVVNAGGDPSTVASGSSPGGASDGSSSSPPQGGSAQSGTSSSSARGSR